MMRIRRRGEPSSPSHERGQMLVLAALVLTIVLGMGALAVDLGFMIHERQSVQGAVDAGALAGAQLLPDDTVNAASVALQYTLSNDKALTAAKVSVSFRCLVGDRNGDGIPDAADIPASCDPKADASWFVKNGLAVSPCVPANGDKCNVIVVSASNTVNYLLAPAVGIKQGSTGSVTSAACRGSCGGPPSGLVDAVLIMDRTGSMSSTDLTNARAAGNAILQTWDPKLQWIALGLLGPSQTTSSCTGANSGAFGLAASSGQYDTTTVSKWVPVGLSGTGAPVNEAYLNANGTLNTSSTLVKAINCFNTSGTGTNLSTPVKMARQYLLANGRAGAKKGIILETDGTPNFSSAGTASDFTCQAAFNEAQTSKTAGIEIFTIGFGLAGTDVCPDSSGTYKNKPATTLLADMATTSVDNGCTSAENTDGDHFFCLPKTSQLTSIFQTVAGALAAGSHLIVLPQ